MSFIPKPHEIYKHFKGNLYQIAAIAEHTETGEILVIYLALYGDGKMYARPLEQFVSLVDKEKYPNVKQEFRFELQGPDSDRQRKESNMSAGITEQDPETKQSPQLEQEPDLDPMVTEFLDADSYEQRLNILAGIHHRVTDDMITTMAIACDVEVEEGDTEKRFESLRKCLLTLEKYECNRLR